MKKVFALIILAVITMVCFVFSAEAANANKIELYFLDDVYKEYISMPSNMRTKFRIPISGNKYSNYRYEIDGESVSVSDDFVVEPYCETTNVISGVNMTVTQKNEYYEGESTVTVYNKSGNLVATYVFDVKPYSDYYCKQVMSDYISANINSSMTEKQKLEKICQFVCRYPYNNQYSSAVSMITTGEGGDCWASADAIVEMCKMVGIKSRFGAEEQVSIFTGGHLIPVCKIDGKYAYVEANLVSNAPDYDEDVYIADRGYWIAEYDYPYITKYVSDGEVAVGTYLGFGGNEVIPSEIDGKKVVKIDSLCFSLADSYLEDGDKLTGVTIPDTVKYIGSSAFYECKDIKSIYLSKNIESLGLSAFGHCDSLNLQIDSKNPYFCVDPAQGIIYSKNKDTLIMAYKAQVKDIVISQGVKYIGDCAFYNYPIESVKFPEGLIDIGYSAFTYCTLNGQDLIIPRSVTGIGYGAFYDTDIRSITILNPQCVINNTVENNLNQQETGMTLGGQKPEGNITVAGEKGSTAEEYVKKYGNNGEIYIFSKPCPILLSTGSHNTRVVKTIKERTCNDDGEYIYGCTGCDMQYYAEVGSYTEHSKKWVVEERAGLKSSGEKKKVCKHCDKVFGWSVIEKITSVKLENTRIKYTGKNVSVKATIKDSDGKTLKEGTDYVLEYQGNRKNIGKRKVKVVFKGNYKGSKVLEYEIVPGKVKNLKVSSNKLTSVKLSWNKVDGAEKYEIYQKSGSKWKKIKTTSKTKYTVKNLEPDKKYEFRVRAVKNKTKGSYSSILKVKTVPETTSLKLKSGKKILTASWSKVSDISGYEVQYSTSKKMKSAKTVNVKKSAKKTTVKKLKKDKKYYVRIRTYKTVDGKKIYSSWSKVKSVKVK